jgi:hypothetical protein
VVRLHDHDFFACLRGWHRLIVYLRQDL